eukprot:11824012-Alexandrium_andersonii.AAC.1
MSASLVGSEMCIRDSLTYTDIHITGAANACSSLPRFAAVSRAASLGGLPVSYTHLTLPTICSV